MVLKIARKIGRSDDTWKIDVKRRRTRQSILETSLDDGKTWDQKCHSLLKTISLRVPTFSFTDDSVVGWVIGWLWIGASPNSNTRLKITLSGKNAQLLSLNTLNVVYVNFRLLFVYWRVLRVYALNGRQSEIERLTRQRQSSKISNYCHVIT